MHTHPCTHTRTCAHTHTRAKIRRPAPPRPFQPPSCRASSRKGPNALQEADVKGPASPWASARAVLLRRWRRGFPDKARGPAACGGDSAGAQRGRSSGQRGPASRGPVAAVAPPGEAASRACATVTVYSERDEATGRDAAAQGQSRRLSFNLRCFPVQFVQWNEGPDGRSV